jgi:hypothetical protein
MSNPLFESDWLDFSGDENVPVTISHNLGRCPKAIQFLGKNGEVNGFPIISGAENSGPRLERTTDPNSVDVYKPDAYTFEGQFKLRVY